ncbi:MAG TPA: hypothetical protein VGA78_12645 [Gemmatimonadales bacterium]
MPHPYFALVALAVVVPQERSVPLDSAWELSGEATRIENYRGTRAIRIRTGQAVRRDVSLGDGTIEFDVAMALQRSFVYLRFRMVSESEHEEIYFRPHKTSLPDAVQYSPVWNGDSNWQLYHGPGSTAAISFAREEWIRVRLVLSGRRAALFVGARPTPEMVIALGRSPVAGYLSFGSFVPGAASGEPAAAFTNLVVKPGQISHDFGPEAPAPPVPPGLVSRWQLSPAFVVPRGIVATAPDSLLAGRSRWPAFTVEPTGVLVIGRHLRRPAPQAATVARLVLQSSTARLQQLKLGYSDYVTVIVNGKPLFAGDAHYSFDEPRQEGLIGLYQSIVWLPLLAGENEVLLVVADGFGGWGLMGQLVD